MAASAQSIAAAARAAVGARHAWGGASPQTGFDGPGLARYVYAQHGIDLPANAWDQVTVGAEVPVHKLQPGDLLFLSADAGRQGDQVGIYLDRGRFVHAPGPGEKVKVSSLTDGYYMDRLTQARRVPGVVGIYPASS